MTHDLCVPQKNTCLHPSYSESDIENYSISLMEKITLLNIPKFIPLHQVFTENLLLSHITKDLAMAHAIPTASESCFLVRSTRHSCIDCLVRPFKGTASKERKRWEEEKRSQKFPGGDAAEGHTDLLGRGMTWRENTHSVTEPDTDDRLSAPVEREVPGTVGSTKKNRY